MIRAPAYCVKYEVIAFSSKHAPEYARMRAYVDSLKSAGLPARLIDRQGRSFSDLLCVVRAAALNNSTVVIATSDCTEVRARFTDTPLISTIQRELYGFS